MKASAPVILDHKGTKQVYLAVDSVSFINRMEVVSTVQCTNKD